MLNFVAVQESAAWALGEIAVKGSPKVVDDILAILIASRVDRDYDVRYAVLKAVRRLGGIINIENIPPIFTVFTSSLNDEDAESPDSSGHNFAKVDS